ncbi:MULTISPECIES: molybdate ABC transporter substrate-binding protein [unclassified Marinovum]
MHLTRRHFLAMSAAALALPARAGGAPVIAAAASLRFALPDLLTAFAASGGGPIRVAYGSSGTLAQQIRNGAPFEVFLSADETYVTRLAKEGTLPDTGTVYALGRLALIVPKGGTLAVDPQLDGLATALDSGALKRFAIANPDHAPYGLRAQEALSHRGLWAPLQPHLVFGENVAQAAQFAVSGNADGGLIAASLAAAGPVAALGTSALIPAEWHSPLRQHMALTATASDTAKALFTFLQTPEAQAIFANHGFAPPEEI